MPARLTKARKRLAQGNFIIPSPREIKSAGKKCGDRMMWPALLLASWGIPNPPPRGWRERLEAQWHALNPQLDLGD